METNPQLELAFDFLEYTGKSLFLTGKAGTGKTTFLRELKRRSPKRMIVAAPTGVAAINAGGVTLHSFFQLPFGPYVPDKTKATPGENSFSNKFSREKVNIIRSMDLLVIDEISMVRADVLDAVSDVLCRYRDRSKPFGGVQLLLIGDIQQLAPVAKEGEWELLREYYASPFFFCSRALKELPYLSLELTHVYRQADSSFIELLNKVREGRMDQESMALLNTRYIPGFLPDDTEKYITLTTHNYQAQQINRDRLEKLEDEPFQYEAEVRDEFPEYAYPTDACLVLKKGAQVMFVKNDSSPEKRYYNGKIGTVTELSEKHIRVMCEEDVIEVSREEWTNTKYTIDPDTHEIMESVLGVFRQYPLRTAWAITIHKSQGLTFERAIIDAASAFAHGQVYVALSRCKTLEGMVLTSMIHPKVLIEDKGVLRFAEDVRQSQPGEPELLSSRKEYYLQLLKELFNYMPVLRRWQYVVKLFNEHLWKLYPELTERFRSARDLLQKDVVEVGEKFQQQLERMLFDAVKYEEDPEIRERIEKGVGYFMEKILPLRVLLEESDPESDNKDIRKALHDAFEKAHKEIELKVALLESVQNGFSVKRYLAVRAENRIEKPETGKKNTVKKEEVSTDILHPELYQLLKEWRAAEAQALNLPAYTVLHQKALLGIVNTLPTGKKELLAIHGIGKKVIERYGVKLLEIIDSYRMQLK